MPLQTGDRVTYVRGSLTSYPGTVEHVGGVYVGVRLDNGARYAFMQDTDNEGRASLAYGFYGPGDEYYDTPSSRGHIELSGEPRVEPMFAVGDPVIYAYNGVEVPGTVETIVGLMVGVLFDPDSSLAHDRRCFNYDGRYMGGRTLGGWYYGSSTTSGRLSKAVDEVEITDLDPSFRPGTAVKFNSYDGKPIAARIEQVDDRLIYVKIDEAQSSIPEWGVGRVFKLNGTGTGIAKAELPEGYKYTLNSQSLTLDPLAWEPTKGREYPEKPQFGYGIFDNYYGRPLKEGNPTGHPPRTAWGVLNLEDDQSQGLYQSREEGLQAGYYSNAIHRWRERCYQVDIDALGDQLKLIEGLEVYRAWAHSDSFGFEVYFPEAVSPVRKRFSLTFGFGPSLVAYGLTGMDDLNRLFNEEAGAMRIESVEDGVITINGVSFKPVPRLTETADLQLTGSTSNVKLMLLQALAISSEASAAPEQMAA